MELKNKHLSQLIHKSCNNRHANLYYTNTNANHDKYARDGKKLRKRKKHQTKHKSLTLTTKKNEICFKQNKSLQKQKPNTINISPSNTWWSGHYYSQIFFTDHDNKAMWCTENETTTLKPDDCHCIKIKSTLNISFSDAKPKHKILWKNFFERDGYIQSNNCNDDNIRPIKQVSNIEQCDIMLSSSYSYNHFPQKQIHKSFTINTIPFSRG
eukprot:452501_1